MIKLVSLQHCSNLVVMVVMEEVESGYEAPLLPVALPCSPVLFIALVYHSTSHATGKLVHVYQFNNCESDFF